MDLSMIMEHAQKMGDAAKKQQEELKAKKFDGAAGGDMVSVQVNGEGRLLKVDIKKDAVDVDDLEMLSDLIVAAFSDAFKKVSEERASGVDDITGGLDLSSMGIDLGSIFK